MSWLIDAAGKSQIIQMGAACSVVSSPGKGILSPCNKSYLHTVSQVVSCSVAVEITKPR